VAVVMEAGLRDKKNKVLQPFIFAKMQKKNLATLFICKMQKKNCNPLYLKMLNLNQKYCKI
jgi:hypothetical protein